MLHECQGTWDFLTPREAPSVYHVLLCVRKSHAPLRIMQQVLRSRSTDYDVRRRAAEAMRDNPGGLCSYVLVGVLSSVWTRCPLPRGRLSRQTFHGNQTPQAKTKCMLSFQNKKSLSCCQNQHSLDPSMANGKAVSTVNQLSTFNHADPPRPLANKD